MVDCAIKHLKTLKLLEEEYNTISATLNQCISVSETWVTTCKQLTQVFWPNYSLHTWTDEPHVPENLDQLISRLKEVIIYTILSLLNNPDFVRFSTFVQSTNK